MSLGASLKLGLGFWFVAEAIAFILVAKLIGGPETLVLTLLTSVIGWMLLKRAGASAMLKLRAALGGRRVVDGNGRHVLDDTLASIGALALLMPGFLSDVIGLVMAVPAARNRLARYIQGVRLPKTAGRGEGHRSAGPSTIDLDPADWKRTGSPQEPLSKY